MIAFAVAWLRDHQWRPLMLLGLAALTTAAVGPGADLGNPLGASYQGVHPGTVVYLCSGPLLVIALRSRCETEAGVPVPPRMRLAWLATLLVAVVLILRVSLDDGVGIDQSIWHLGVGAAVPVLLAVAAGEGPVMLYALLGFALCLLTPAFAQPPWWNPFLTDVPDVAGIVGGGVLLAGAGAAFATRPGRLAT